MIRENVYMDTRFQSRSFSRGVEKLQSFSFNEFGCSTVCMFLILPYAKFSVVPVKPSKIVNSICQNTWY